MFGKLLLSSLFCFSLTSNVQAAEMQSTDLTLTVQEAAALTGVKLEDDKPTQMTAEEKLKVQQPLRQDINYVSENYRKNELDMVVEAIKTMENNKLRRLNRSRRPTEKIKVKNVKVNTKKPTDVSDFLNAKITNTLQQSMPEDTPSVVTVEQEN